MIKEVLFTPVVVIHVIACVLLILVVLLQPGKSGGLGAFSGVAAQQVFGGRGAGNVLTKISWSTASIFFLTSMGLAFMSSSSDESLASRGEKMGKLDEAPITANAASATPQRDEAVPEPAPIESAAPAEVPASLDSAEPAMDPPAPVPAPPANPQPVAPQKKPAPAPAPGDPGAARPAPVAPAPQPPAPGDPY